MKKNGDHLYEIAFNLAAEGVDQYPDTDDNALTMSVRFCLARQHGCPAGLASRLALRAVAAYRAKDHDTRIDLSHSNSVLIRVWHQGGYRYLTVNDIAAFLDMHR